MSRVKRTLLIFDPLIQLGGIYSYEMIQRRKSLQSLHYFANTELIETKLIKAILP